VHGSLHSKRYFDLFSCFCRAHGRDQQTTYVAVRLHHSRRELATSPPGVVRSTVMSMPVCLSVCQTIRSHISKTTQRIFTKFCEHANGGRGSILLWQRCDTLCTSGFTDDVMVLNNVPVRVFFSGYESH